MYKDVRYRKCEIVWCKSCKVFIGGVILSFMIIYFEINFFEINKKVDLDCFLLD